MDKKILENEGNIQMRYEVQNNGNNGNGNNNSNVNNNEVSGRSDPKNSEAVQEVIG